MRRCFVSLIQIRTLVFSFFLLATFCGGVFASGPKYVAGPNYFQASVKGQPVIWAGGQVSYFLDQGALSSFDSNSAAAAMVSQAAAVWNAVPTAAVQISLGGSLGEDVSGNNTTANQPAGTGAVLPADAQPSATNPPVAVIFDADGSVISDIYGTSASVASDCVANGVRTVIDNFSNTGTIVHARIVINGLCATSAAMNGLLQYELVRAFGVVLGLDFSQVNEAMWVASAPTTDGLAGWPVMHPFERLCAGSQTNCMPNQTTLRMDDIAGVNRAYPVTSANQSSWPGKTLTASATLSVKGTVQFRNGQGMQGVNVVLSVLDGSGSPDLRYTVATVSGASFLRDAATPVSGATDAQGNARGRFGTDDMTQEGAFDLSGVPLPSGASSAAYQLSLEAVNPLYTGDAAVGPYNSEQMAPSGTMQTVALGTLTAGSTVTQSFVLSDSADGTATDDGTEMAPSQVAGNGEWIAKLTGYSHSGWFQFHAKANRYFTVEVAALGENGLASESKTAPLIGVWSGVDAFGSAPDLATTMPFNGEGFGLSTLSAATVADGDVRFAVSDVRGDGRPDDAYRARVLYADTVFPARLTMNGGTIAIYGQGFRQNATVTVNGATAAVMSVTPTEITAMAPAANGVTGTVVVAVTDPQTLAVAEIEDGLSYDAQGTDAIGIVAAPTGTVQQGVPVPMTVQVKAADNKTPAANVTVSFAVATGGANLGCGAATCNAISNGDGQVTMMLTPTSTQSTRVAASLTNGANVSAEFNAGSPPSIAATNTLYIAVGAQSAWLPQALVLSGTQAVQGAVVNWTGSSGVQVQTAQSRSDAAGHAVTQVIAGPLAAGTTATVTATQAGTSSFASFTVTAERPELAGLIPVSGVGQIMGVGTTAQPVVMQVVDAFGHPLAGAAVSVYQTMSAWEPPCPAGGRCATAPLLAQANSAATSDANGLVTFAPLANNGQAVVIRMEATTGSQGSLESVITLHP